MIRILNRGRHGGGGSGTRMVAATQEIRQPGSPITRFLRAEFPVLSDLSADFQSRVQGAETLAPEAPGSDYPWSLVGTAIDYRLRFLFEKVPVHPPSCLSFRHVVARF